MLRKSVVMFLTKTNGAYDPIGSGTLVFHEGRVLIVSAARVYEDLGKCGNAHLQVVDKIFSLDVIRALVSNAEPFANIRDHDFLDLGALIPNNVCQLSPSSPRETETLRAAGSRLPIRGVLPRQNCANPCKRRPLLRGVLQPSAWFPIGASRIWCE